MAMQLRNASGNDAALMAALHAACLPPGWSVAEFRDLLQGGAAAWVAEADGAAAGFMLCRLAGQEAEIITFCVGETWRRQGIGRALLSAACELPVQELFLEVAADNAAALGLYRAAGFQEVGRRARYYQNGQDALVFRRNLP